MTLSGLALRLILLACPQLSSIPTKVCQSSIHRVRAACSNLGHADKEESGGGPCVRACVCGGFREDPGRLVVDETKGKSFPKAPPVTRVPPGPACSFCSWSLGLSTKASPPNPPQKIL